MNGIDPKKNTEIHKGKLVKDRWSYKIYKMAKLKERYWTSLIKEMKIMPMR